MSAQKLYTDEMNQETYDDDTHFNKGSWCPLLRINHQVFRSNQKFSQLQEWVLFMCVFLDVTIWEMWATKGDMKCQDNL